LNSLGWSSADSSWYEAQLYHIYYKLLTAINLQSSKREEIAEALQLTRSIQNVERVFLLAIFSQLLGAIDLALNYLQ